MAPIIIDDEAKLHALLISITERVRIEKNQLLFVDLEGVDLGRSGKVAIMQLLMPPNPTVYLVDVHLLKARAFEATTPDGTSLKSVLQSPIIFKVFFDIRNDSDALYAHFGINVAGVIDLQVIEYATRNPRGKFVNGLAKCIERDLPYVPGWQLTKINGRRLFAPEVGGRYEVFLDRPMAADIVKYCEQDVMLMPRLLLAYGPKLQAGVAVQIQAIVDERIRSSQASTYNGKGQHKAIGPYLAPARECKNMSTSPEVDLVRSARLGHLCRLDNHCVDDLISRFDVVHIKPNKAASAGNKYLGLTSMARSAPHSAASNCNTSKSPSNILLAKSPHPEEEYDDHEDDFKEVWEEYAAMEHENPSDQDFTACSAEDCGFCGQCQY